MRIRYLFLLSIMALSACGFHLRGSQVATTVDLSNVYVRSIAAGKLIAEVNIQLQAAGASTVKTSAKAQYILTIENESIGRSVLSISAETGKVEEYQLTLSASMSVSQASDAAVLVDESINVVRDYTFDEDAVLGKSAEEAVLREDLVRQAAAQIIRYLNAAMKNK